jgi:CheY-like chemotaxis protein
VEDVVAVVTDLFFQARISSAAKAAGRTVRFVASQAALPEDAAGVVALVDLDAGLDVVESIRLLKAAGAKPVVAFGPHLDVTLRKRARAAGADRVLAKSKFVTDLPHILTGRTGSSPA